MTVESPNKMTSIRHIRKGLAIYKTGRSPYWLIRLRNPFEGKYITRSSKETSRVEATDAANEYADSFFRKANGDLAMKKVTSFEYYADQMLAGQKGRAKSHDSDRKLLYRQKDGIIRHFGDYDITKISTRMIREYLTELDRTRGKPLAESTRAKHVIVIRKVLALAVEDGLMKTIPVMPRQKTEDTPRHAFTGDEYKLFMKAGTACVSRKDEVRGVQVTGKATTAGSALEHALINRLGTVRKVTKEFLLRSDNGLVFTSYRYTALVRSYGLKQEFITPHCPEQNGMAEPAIPTIKEQCIHRQRFDSIQHATRAISDWISFYNHRRPHQALDMKTPAEAFAFAA